MTSFSTQHTNPSADITSAFLDSLIGDTLAQPSENSTNHDSHVARRELHVHTCADLEQRTLSRNRIDQLIFARDQSPAGGSEATRTNSLVQTPKSPTPQEMEASRRVVLQKQEFMLEGRALAKRHAATLEKLEPGLHRISQERIGAEQMLPAYQKTPFVLDVTAPVPEGPLTTMRVDTDTGEYLGEKKVLGQSKPIAILRQREWSGEFQFRVQGQGSLQTPPPQQEGERLTEQLNSRAASKIMDSGAYVSVLRGGFTTFLTLTFDDAARERIASGENTIGAEVSRFFDGLTKMYQRGWSCDGEVLREKNGYQSIGASAVNQPFEDKLDYIWVAEMPENEKGEPNPHCHVLLRWNVEPWLFYDWAYRIEKLWGHGFAKLERIRNANAAGDYLLKALGYVTKGEAQDQGKIRGNRYNISRSARAPAWEVIAEFDAQNMIAIINELRERYRLKDAPIKAKLKVEKLQQERDKKAYAINKVKKGIQPEKRKGILAKLMTNITERDERINECRKALDTRPAKFFEYQANFKGMEALVEFMEWSAAKRFWNAELITGAMRDWEHLRESVGLMVKSCRDYHKKLAERIEDSEISHLLMTESDIPPEPDDDGFSMAEWAEYQLQGEAA